MGRLSGPTLGHGAEAISDGLENFPEANGSVVSGGSGAGCGAGVPCLISNNPGICLCHTSPGPMGELNKLFIFLSPSQLRIYLAARRCRNVERHLPGLTPQPCSPPPTTSRISTLISGKWFSWIQLSEGTRRPAPWYGLGEGKLARPDDLGGPRWRGDLVDRRWSALCS